MGAVYRADSREEKVTRDYDSWRIAYHGYSRDLVPHSQVRDSLLSVILRAS